MKLTALVFAASVVGAAASSASAEDRPTTKVVKLLEKMLKTSQADGKKEREMFAKFKCFCDTNTEEKTSAIATAEERIAELSSAIEELRGSSGKLSMEVAQLQSDMDANKEARDTAVSIREKQNKAFLAAEADMEAAIASMGQAISTLAAIGADQTDDSTRDQADHKHAMGAGFLAKSSRVKRAGESIQSALTAASALLSKKDQAAVAEELSFIQSRAAPGVYSSQSSEIIGILKNMRDTFESNLKEARTTESNQEEAHAKFMATKEEEFDLMSKSFDAKQSQLGANDTELAAKKEDLQATQKQLAEDQSFLADLTAMCKEKTALYEDRKNTRSMEEAAIAQAVSILSSDEAFATFGKTTATSGAFVQLKSKSRALSPRQSVMKMLLLAAKNTKSLKLAKVAVALQTGNAFTKVLKTIDSMIALIDEEEKADDDKKAWCDEERAANKQSKEEYEAEIESLEGKIDQLKVDIEQYNTDLNAANASLIENKKNQAEETETRKQENADYLEDVKHLKAAQELLQDALNVLKKFYDHLHAKQGAHHYEKQAGTNSKGGGYKRTHITIIASDPEYDAKVEELKELCSKEPECVGFDTQGWLKNDIGETYEAAGSDLFEKVFDEENQATLLQQGPVYEGEMFEDEFKGQRDAGVLGLIEGIKEDTAKEEEAADKAEKEALEAYEKSMADLADEQKTLEETIATLEGNIAKAEVDKANAEQDLKKTTAALDKVVAYLAQIKPGCDFIDENLDLRKKSRAAEKTALEGAIKLLKGTPAFKAAVTAAEQEALGECKDICNKAGREHAECEACLADTSVPGFCAGHPGTPGC